MPALGTENLYPVTPAHMVAGVVITQLGREPTVTATEFEHEQPLELVTVTEIVAVPADPAVQVISFALTPAVIEPLLADQE